MMYMSSCAFSRLLQPGAWAVAPAPPLGPSVYMRMARGTVRGTAVAVTLRNIIMVLGRVRGGGERASTCVAHVTPGAPGSRAAGAQLLLLRSPFLPQMLVPIVQRSVARVAGLRALSTTAARRTDFVQDLYLRELKAYKPTPPVRIALPTPPS